MGENIPFEERLPVIKGEIAKRKNKWTYSGMEFADVESIITIRVFKKYHLYDPSKVEFTHWLNRLISNAIKNIMRDVFLKYQRPCISGCVYAVGNDGCSFTKSKIQCEECPLYKKWKCRKQNQFFVNQTLTIENHSQEVNNMQNDFMDIDQSKQIIDHELKNKLNSFEWSVYEMLYIKNMSMEEVGEKLNYKKTKNSKIPGSQSLKKLEKKFIEVTKQIILEQGLA